MFGTTFAHDELAKYTAIFGTLFNNIHITRDDEDGKTLQSFKVPCAYGPREKFLARSESDPELNRPYAEILPRIAFELKTFKYDPERKKITGNRWSARKTRGDQRISYDSMFMPVPYNLTFELTILANRLNDATRIVGQILPFFTPDFTVTAQIIPEMPDYKIDLPIVLSDVDLDDEYDGSFAGKRRIIEFKLTFVMKAELFGPVTESKIIKVAKVNLYADTDGDYDLLPSERVVTQPGLTPEGRPTTVLSESISPLKIDEDDNYGYIITVIPYPEG